MSIGGPAFVTVANATCSGALPDAGTAEHVIARAPGAVTLSLSSPQDERPRARSAVRPRVADEGRARMSYLQGGVERRPSIAPSRHVVAPRQERAGAQGEQRPGGR